MISVMQCFLFKWKNYALSLINFNGKERSRGETKGGNFDCTVAVFPSSEGIQQSSHAPSPVGPRAAHSARGELEMTPTLCLIHPRVGFALLALLPASTQFMCYSWMLSVCVRS